MPADTAAGWVDTSISVTMAYPAGKRCRAVCKNMNCPSKAFTCRVSYPDLGKDKSAALGDYLFYLSLTMKGMMIMTGSNSIQKTNLLSANSSLLNVSRIPVIDPHPLSAPPGYEYRWPEWPWIMVPVGKTRILHLGIDGKSPVTIDRLTANGEVASLGLSFCKASLNGSALSITGMLNKRNIPIDLYQPGRQLRVWVTVKAKRDVQIIAHYVEHGPLLKTKITREQLREVIKNANLILNPQANVNLVLARETALSYKRIGKRLGFSVDQSSNDKKDERALLTKYAQEIPTARGGVVNLFLVRSLKKREDKKDNPLANMDENWCCVFEDHLHMGGPYDTKMAGHSLAHEVVHALMAVHINPFQPYIDNNLPGKIDHAHTSGNHSLMHPAGLGTRLSRAEIERINPSPPMGNSLMSNPFNAPAPDLHQV